MSKSPAVYKVGNMVVASFPSRPISTYLNRPDALPASVDAKLAADSVRIRFEYVNTHELLSEFDYLN